VSAEEKLVTSPEIEKFCSCIVTLRVREAIPDF
jgi:hypothetical protein